MSLPTITITGEHLGALFAAVEKPHYDGVDREGAPDVVARNLAKALRQDAEEFSDLIGGTVDPVDLIHDFLRRA